MPAGSCNHIDQPARRCPFCGVPGYKDKKMDTQDKPYIITEDDVKVYEGDLVYNYYDMRPVRIPEFREMDLKDIEAAITNTGGSLKRDIWVSMKPTQEGVRGSDLLNGERICSMAFAKRRGFRGA
jgi:hypothetical protein